MKIWGSNKGFIDFSPVSMSHSYSKISFLLSMPFCLIFFNILRISGYRLLYIFCQFIPICFNIFAINMELFCIFVCLR